MKRALPAVLAAFGDERPRLARMLQGRLRCAATTADLLQDVWIKLAGLEPKVSGAVKDPHAFVRSVARNAALDHLRKERRHADIDAELGEILWERVDSLSPERILMGREAAESLRRTLEALPEQSRRIFVMNRFGGHSHRAIARELGIAEQTVHYHIRRVLDALAACRDALPD